MTMKRTIALLCALALVVFTLTACGSGYSSPQKTAQTFFAAVQSLDLDAINDCGENGRTETGFLYCGPIQGTVQFFPADFNTVRTDRDGSRERDICRCRARAGLPSETRHAVLPAGRILKCRIFFAGC